MGFSRQEYWSGLPFPSPGNLPEPAIEPEFPALQADCLLPTREAQKLPCVPAISLLSIYPKERKTGTQYPKERKAGTQTCNLYTQVHSSIIHNDQNVAATKSLQWCLTQQLPWIYLHDPGIEPTSLTSPALAGRFFTTSTPWEAPYMGANQRKMSNSPSWL